MEKIILCNTRSVRLFSIRVACFKSALFYWYFNWDYFRTLHSHLSDIFAWKAWEELICSSNIYFKIICLHNDWRMSKSRNYYLSEWKWETRINYEGFKCFPNSNWTQEQYLPFLIILEKASPSVNKSICVSVFPFLSP